MKKLLLSLVLMLWAVSACAPRITPVPSLQAQSLPEVTPSPSPAPAFTAVPSPTETLPAPAPSSGSLLPFTQLTRLDVLNGWGVRDTRVLRTTDSGRTWQDVTPSDLHSEMTVTLSGFFPSAEEAWVCLPALDRYDSGTLYRTTDGGQTWHSAPVPFGWANFFRAPASAQTVLAQVSLQGLVELHRTRDGGQTWELVMRSTAGDEDAPGRLPVGMHTQWQIAAQDEQTLWAVGISPAVDGLYLYHSGDGGVRWERRPLDLPESPSGFYAEGLRFFDGQSGAFSIFYGSETFQRAFFVTRDGGASWQLTPGIPAVGNTWSAPDALHWWVWDGENLRLSQDGGWTWQTAPANPPETPESLVFSDPLTGWAVQYDENGHRLYGTTDGAQTWELLAEDVP
ncbi:hypothetical protein [Anaerolinea sp.]|uniref:hypothetical protein n=1 Tax=Anaerolinea sp. TaxID=1872519 RepID=UPI002ACE81D5|nr:hypothetical protein [Anaerolinea sp.]